MHTGVHTSLVAPLTVGDDAYTGAGSVVTGVLLTLLLTAVSALGVAVLSYHTFRAPRIVAPAALQAEAES